MRVLVIFALALTFSGCANRDAAYRRSLMAPHPDLPQSDFEQIAELLSHRTRQSITSIETLPSDKVLVYTAFRGAEGPGLSNQFTLAKRDGRWHVVESRDETIVE
jgi:hypothetical protein